MSSFISIARNVRPTAFRPSILHRNKLSSNFFLSSRPTRDLLLPTSKSTPSSLRRLYSSSSGSYGPDNTKLNMYVLYGLMGINGAVFAYHKYCEEQARQGDKQPLMNWYNNFTVSLNGVTREGRWWTVLTSVFAQAGVMHLAGNLLTVYYMGELVARTPGVTPIRLLVLVIGSGLAGSAFWLYQQNSKEGRQKYLSRALGFSGAVSGVGAVAAIMYPKVTAMIYGIVPMPLWALVGGYLLYDGYFLNSENTRIAHSGHLGGVAFGAVYYLLRLRGVTLPRGRKYYY